MSKTVPDIIDLTHQSRKILSFNLTDGLPNNYILSDIYSK